MKNKKISVIVACYNEQDSIDSMYKRIVNVFKDNRKYDYEIIFVDNDSQDNSEAIFNKLAKNDRKVKVIFMSRNFGSPQPSFIAGLKYANADAVVLLHGDIQDPPELISRFIKKWEMGYKVVYGVRKTRKGYGFLMNFFYKSFYYLLQKLAYIKIPLNAGDFSLIDKVVVKELLKIDEYDYYLRCLRAYVGFKQIGIDYVRDMRKHGRSTETFFTGLWWAKTIIVNFSFKPLELISKIALIVMLFSFLLIVINVFMILVYNDSPRGIPTIVILILFLGGVQLLSLSIIAEYMAKIFLEVKRRPRYIIKEKLNLKD
jgi:dolichol-phosphate mannosyltransferase